MGGRRCYAVVELGALCRGITGNVQAGVLGSTRGL